MILHELEMGYIHEYIRMLSDKIIDTIKNKSQNLEKIRIYENKLIQFLGLIYEFFQLEIIQENFLPHFVIFSDELFDLFIYSDNFELIIRILMNLKGKASNWYSRLNQQNR